MEKTLQPNGYKPKSYGDIISIAVLISMLLSTVLWFLKLDARNENLANMLILMQARTSKIETKVDSGILDIAAERIATLQVHHAEIETRFNAWIKNHDENFVPASHLQDDINELKEELEALENRVNKL